MIKQLLLAILIGCISTLYYLQEDPWCKQIIADHVCKQLSNSLECKISTYSAKDLNIPAGSITLSNVVVHPQDNKSWYWSANTLSLSFSWTELLLYGTLDLIIHLSCFDMQSKYHNNTLDIQSHIDTLFFASKCLPMPTILKKVSLNNAHIRIHDQNDHSLCMLKGSAQLKKIYNAIKGVIHIESGKSTYEDRTLFQQLYGSIDINARTIETQPNITIGGSCSLQIPYLEQQSTQCHIAGNWHNSQGSLHIKNSDHSFDIVTRIHEHDISVTAHAPISSIWRWAYNTTEESILTGSCKLQAKGNLQSSALKGYILVKEVIAAGNSVASLGRCTFEKNNTVWSGTLYGQRKSGMTCSGLWQFNQNSGTGALRIVNNTSLFITPSSHWCIPAHEAELACSFDCNYTINGTFHCSAHQAKLRSRFNTHGTLSGKQGSLNIHGSAGNNTYHADFTLYPHVHLSEFSYNNQDNKALISLHTHKDNIHELSGAINFGYIREILNALYSYDLQGEGYFNTHLLKKDSGVDLSLKLVDGTIRLPQTYNFINGFYAHLALDWVGQRLTMNNMHCQLHKGSFSSKRASLHYTDDGSISFACAPLFFNDCLLNIQKDLFATVSGRLTLQQALYGLPVLKGVVVLNQSQLNENIFSHTSQQSLMRNAKNIFASSTTDMHLDIALLNSSPVHVKTPFLETNAHIQLTLSNTMRHPNITGSIQLRSGELTFPYKPLYINKGSIYFMPNQLYDPMIELEARNTIKKFNISMHVAGSVKNHHIHLHSSPPLSEEQIMALLLVGSQEESLNIVMPALIMQNVKQLLFGSEQTNSKIGKYFTGLLKPFNHISLVPSFVDQTGRGGLRGAVEINVHDRLRALIQKNFSLTEDTRFEIEYMLSDDISLRGVRDERRDVSGELEMKWKF